MALSQNPELRLQGRPVPEGCVKLPVTSLQLFQGGSRKAAERATQLLGEEAPLQYEGMKRGDILQPLPNRNNAKQAGARQTSRAVASP